MSDATSLAESTTESATGGSLVECTPNTCAAWRRIGSRNHHAASAPTRATTRIASRNSPLRQPFTVSHVIHRTSGLERALHQIERAHERRLGELESAERLLEPGEGGGPGVPRRARERQIARSRRRARERGRELRLPFVRHVTQKLERQMETLPADPLHGKPQVTRACRGGPQRLADGCRKIQGNEEPHARSARLASRPPRR